MAANSKTREPKAPEATTPVVPTPDDEQRIIDEQTTDRTSVAYLRSEQKRIAEELKAAKATEKSKKPGRVTGDAAPSNATKALAARVQKRIKAGYDRETAISLVLDQMHDAILVLLDAHKPEAQS